MAGTLSAGVNSLILKLDQPYDTIRTSDIRDDLVKVIVWCSATAGFTPSNANKVFDGLSLSIIIPKLSDGTELVSGIPYYVKYAFISDIQEEVYTVSTELTATPVVVAEAFSPPTFYISNYGSVFRRDIDNSIYPNSITIETGYSNFKSSPAPTFQWKKNGTNISGATNFSYSVPSTDYDSVVTNTYSCVVAGKDLGGNDSTITSSTTIPLIADGTRGPRTATGYLYYQTPAAINPGQPTVGTYDFSTGQFSTLTDGWGYLPISPSTTDTTLKGWSCRYSVTEPNYGSATNSTVIGTTAASITFDGIVTFTNYANGATPLATAASVAGKLDTSTANSSTFANSLVANTTVIDGGKITTGIISANRLDLSGVLTVASVGTGGTTEIDGARITTGTINAARLNLSGYLQVGSAANDINTNTTQINGGQISTGSISANRLSIGNTTGVDRIRLYDNKIEIWANNGSGTSVRRVVLGDLS